MLAATLVRELVTDREILSLRYSPTNKIFKFEKGLEITLFFCDQALYVAIDAPSKEALFRFSASDLGCEEPWTL